MTLRGVRRLRFRRGPVGDAGVDAVAYQRVRLRVLVDEGAGHVWFGDTPQRGRGRELECQAFDQEAFVGGCSGMPGDGFRLAHRVQDCGFELIGRDRSAVPVPVPGQRPWPLARCRPIG